MLTTVQLDRTRRTPWFVFVAFALVALTGTGLVGADAASLGGIGSETLTASRHLGSSGAPTVVAWDNFDGRNNTNLDGQTTAGGGLTWNAVRGTWRIRGNQADANNNDVALAVAATSPYRAVEATTYRGGTTFDIGLFVNMNAGGTQFISAELTNANNGELQIWRYSNGGWTLLTSTSNLYSGPASGWPTSATMRMTSAPGGALTVTIDGAVVATYTLSAGDQATYQNASHQNFGLYSYYDGDSRWDDFHLDSA